MLFRSVQGQDMTFYFANILLICILLNASPSEALNYDEELTQCLGKNDVKLINNLGFKMQNKMISSPGNSFMSPVGVAFSLGISHLGAAGETAQQIEDVLSSEGTKFSSEKYHYEMQNLLKELQNTGRNFSIFTGFFIQEGFNLNEDFIRNIKNLYFADTQVTNFANNSEFATEDINDYARNKTYGKFEAILSEKVPNATRTLILNAVDFNDAWKVQFLPEKTERDYFYSGRRETTEVWMMSTEVENFKFYEDLEMKYKFLELPYKNEKMSMIIALPTQYDQPANLQLDPETFCEIKSKMVRTKLDMVSIPRFKFEFQTSLKDVLSDLGITDVFDPSLSNLTGISKENDIFLSDIIQKTMVEVDEEGYDAASITKLKFLPIAFRGVKEFIANHPFLFFVQDHSTGAILVAGRVDEPSESISLAENLRFT